MTPAVRDVLRERVQQIGATLPAPRRLDVLRTAIDNVTVEEAIAAICAAAAAPARTTMIHFVHAHALAVAGDDPELRRHLAAADLVLPDGIGVRIAAAMLGQRLRANVNGTDLFAPLLDALAPRGVRLALIGGAPGVADACAGWIRARQPALDVALTSSGYLDAAQIDALRARLRALGPCVVLVGMGTPLQERWAWRHLADLPGLTILTVGGLFDFHAGRVRRAPPAWRDAGLEWLYRLGQEPRRLARRNLINHPLFLARVAAERARGVRR